MPNVLCANIRGGFRTKLDELQVGFRQSNIEIAGIAKSCLEAPSRANYCKLAALRVSAETDRVTAEAEQWLCSRGAIGLALPCI